MVLTMSSSMPPMSPHSIHIAFARELITIEQIESETVVTSKDPDITGLLPVLHTVGFQSML